jgi:hypothetical protein
MLRFVCALTAITTSMVANTSAAQVREGVSPRAAQHESGSTAVAPSRATSSADSSHDYDAKALRFETNWGNVKIIRGVDGALLGTGGWFRDPGLTELFAASPRALTELKDYQRNNFRGSLIGGVGAAATVAGIVVAANSANNASSPIIVVAGISAMVWGAQHLSMSYAALSRAMWWYNRDAVRAPN